MVKQEATCVNASGPQAQYMYISTDALPAQLCTLSIICFLCSDALAETPWYMLAAKIVNQGAIIKA